MRMRPLVLLTLPALLSACVISPDPPPLPPTPNAALVTLSPEVARACQSVTWTLEYRRAGQDVTGTSWYVLTGPDDEPRPEARFTLTADPVRDRSFLAEPVIQQGPPQPPTFSDSLTHTLTCEPTGETALTTVRHATLSPSTSPVLYLGYPDVRVTYEQGALIARPR